MSRRDSVAPLCRLKPACDEHSVVEIAVPAIGTAKDLQELSRIRIVIRVLAEPLGDERRKTHSLAFATQIVVLGDLRQILVDEPRDHDVELGFIESVFRTPSALRLSGRHRVLPLYVLVLTFCWADSTSRKVSLQ